MLDRERWKIADDLFEAALDLPENERAAYLHAHCDDSEIRTKVESLLASAGSSAGFVQPGGAMEGPLGDALLRSSDETAAGEPGRTSPSMPEAIEGYRLIRLVGEGGMGEVWEAEQQGAIQRRVAVKLVKAGLSSAEVIARFDSERLALSRMNQPNIARVYGGGSTQSGRPYFAMEFVDGDRITDYCDRERLSVRQRLILFAEVCDGVQHAHQKGIIHRDIKPSNVLVATEDGKPIPKIIDFGVARAIERAADGSTEMTEIGQVIGTPQYMSPEQTEVGLDDIDTRTDVYSLGVLLYELLVGVRPFELKEASSSSLLELRRQIRETDPERPSKCLASQGENADRVARDRLTQEPRLVRRLRGDLDWIVLRCLEKDPARRYTTPQELAVDVRRHLDGAPVLAGPPSVRYRWGKWIRRHRWAAAAAFVAVAALIAGTVVSTLQAQRALRAERAALEEADTAQHVAAFLEELFDGSDPGVTMGKDPRASELLAAGRARLDTELRNQPRIRARLLHTIGKIQRKLDRADDARSLQQEALELREAHLGRLHEDTIRTLVEIGLIDQDRGNPQGAEETLRDALARVEASESSDSPFHAKIASELAGVLTAQGKNDDALPLQHLALEIFERELGPEHAAVGLSLNGLGITQAAQSKNPEATASFQRALAIREATLGAEHPDVAMTLQNLAGMLGRTGRDDEAEPLLRRSLEIQRKVFGSEHFEVGRCLENLAAFYGRKGQLEESERLSREAAAIYAKTLGADNLRLAGVYGNLGLTNSLQGDFVEAEEFLRQALAIVETQSGPEHPRLPWLLNRLGTLHRKLEHYEEATAYYERALSVLETVHGIDHPRTADAIRGIAAVALDHGNLATAEAQFRRAVTIIETAHGDSFPNLANQLEGLGDTLDRAGRPAEGRAYLERALALHEQTGGPDYPGLVRPLLLLSRIDRQAGNLVVAEKRTERAMAIANAAHGPEHLDVAQALQELAAIHAAAGDTSAAREEARRALALRSAKFPASHSLVRESAGFLARTKN